MSKRSVTWSRLSNKATDKLIPKKLTYISWLLLSGSTLKRKTWRGLARSMEERIHPLSFKSFCPLPPGKTVSFKCKILLLESLKSWSQQTRFRSSRSLTWPNLVNERTPIRFPDFASTTMAYDLSSVNHLFVNSPHIHHPERREYWSTFRCNISFLTSNYD